MPRGGPVGGPLAGGPVGAPLAWGGPRAVTCYTGCNSTITSSTGAITGGGPLPGGPRPGPRAGGPVGGPLPIGCAYSTVYST